MYSVLMSLHSATRWALLIAMVYTLWRAYRGYYHKTFFSKADDIARHWTATIAHIQLVLGIIFYIKSPLIHYFWSNSREALSKKEYVFFGLAHGLLMLLSIIIITIGSALAKRTDKDIDKYKTILGWYGVALCIIFIAIPWPFSPFAMRPLFR